MVFFPLRRPCAPTCRCRPQALANTSRRSCRIGADEAVAFDGGSAPARSGRDGELRSWDQFFSTACFARKRRARCLRRRSWCRSRSGRLPLSPASRLVAANLFHFTDRCGVVGERPLTCGSSSLRLISITLSKYFSDRHTLRVAGEVFAHLRWPVRLGIGATGGAQVAFHAGIVAEGGSGGADPRRPCYRSCLAGTAHGRAPSPKYSTTAPVIRLHGEDAGDFRDHILRAGPAVEFTGQFDADEFRPLEFPGKSGHHVAGVGTADTDGDHAEAAAFTVWPSVPIIIPAGEGVVPEYHLVDDNGARLPVQPMPYLLRRTKGS